MKANAPVIICDLSDVLIKGLEGSEFAIAKALNLPADSVARDLFSADYALLWLGKINEKQFFRGLVQTLGWDIDEEALIRIIHSNFYVIPGVFEIYQKLHKNYTTILYSTNCREWVNKMKQTLDYSSLFDKEYYSFTLGAHKKMTKGYEYIMSQHSGRPVYLIDDSFSNIATAETMGIHGLHFEDARQLKKRLEKENIL